MAHATAVDARRPTRVPGLVSVVVVDYRSSEDTIACLRSVMNGSWPVEQLELVVVVNGGDDGATAISAAVRTAKTLIPPSNEGYAAGVNRGVRGSTGEFVALLNPDSRAHPDFLAEAVAVLRREPDIACVASKVLDESGSVIDFVRPGLSWYGQGFKLHEGSPDPDVADTERDVLFGTGSSLVLRAQTFLDVGGFDERYFMFFEDVDLGWRLWLAGHRVRYVPTAVTYHRHHGTMGSVGPWHEQFLLERNALFTIFKNYDDASLAQMLPGALMLSVRRGVVLGGAQSDSLDLALAEPTPATEAKAVVSKTTLASTYAVDALVRALPALARDRQEIQSRRVRSDAEIMAMFGTPLQPNVSDPAFLRSYEDVVAVLRIGEKLPRRRRVLVVTGDTLSTRMAGPAIRAWHIAEALAAEHDVHLVTTSSCDVQHRDFRVSEANARQLKALEQWCDVLVFQGYLLHEHPALAESAKPIVADIYDPFHLEQLEQARDLGESERRRIVTVATAVLNAQLLRADLVLCASDKQRDFWLGQLAALGRINPVTYDADETLRSLIDVVPFGLPDEPPRRTRRAVKGVIPGIGEDDEVILWGGGIYNWFDPLSLIRAVALLAERRPTVKLLFLGLKHPNPAVPEMRMATRAQELADELGATRRSVFFNYGWVPYDDRQNYLMDADIGVSTHLDHVETAFSFRTRMLDYLWAGLPIVCTEGDSLGTLVRERGLGLTVPPGEPNALADALERLLGDTRLRGETAARVRETAEDFRWSRVLRPLLDFCQNPYRAADLLDADVAGALHQPLEIPEPAWGGVRGDLALVRRYVAEGGLPMAAGKALGRIRRLTRRPAP